MEGAAAKFQFRPLTLEDKIVKDGIEAVGTLTGKEPYYMVGGIGVQSYLSASYRRPTSDIDISIMKPLNYAAFKTITKPLKEYLQDNKYKLSESKHSRSYKIEVENEQNPEEKLLIEFSRRNVQKFDEVKNRLKREFENSKSKILEGKKSTYLVASPEDIVIPKLVRSINSLIRNGEMKNYISKERKPLTEDYVKSKLSFIAGLRKEMMLTPADPELSEKLRLMSDIYDMSVLSEITGINSNYFINASKEWNTITNKTPERDLIVESILPHFLESL